MDEASISAVVAEIAPQIAGRSPGKIFQLGRQSLAIDFGLRSRGFLFISVEPASPRLYLIKRRVRDLDKQSVPLSQLALTLRKELSNMTVLAITKLANDRIVRFDFESADESLQPRRRTLIAQLTGRSANLLLLDENDIVLAQTRAGVGPGQTVDEAYQPPSQNKPSALTENLPNTRRVSEAESVSEQLDAYHTTLATEKAAQVQLAAAQAQLRKEISRRKKLLKQLDSDLASHAEAEQQKRIGDLLLANASSAKRDGNRVVLVDYFADGAPEIEVQIDENLTLPEEATRRFEMYTRSKRARKQIAARIAQVKQELAELQTQRDQLDSGTNSTILNAATSASTERSHSASRKAKADRISGVRRYMSSDGYEMLVGRAARDNDKLTFKVAKPNDLWLHAADYPGSHVVVRNPTRKDVPHRTIVEAAQLAAHSSQAKKDPKVDVHYTQRKFLSKPKGAAPGLVRMSRFKSIVVAPKEAGRRVV